MSSRLKEVKPLKYFIRRSQSLSLFRKFFRASKGLEDHIKFDVREMIRSDFKKNMNVTDDSMIKKLLVDGNRSLKQVTAMGTKTIEEDSWINTKDASDERGRVGSGWPWG